MFDVAAFYMVHLFCYILRQLSPATNIYNFEFQLNSSLLVFNCSFLAAIIIVFAMISLSHRDDALLTSVLTCFIAQLHIKFNLSRFFRKE